jgi:hypothetical protein
MLQDWIESCEIKVLSIYDAKTKYKDSSSFRVCIADSDSVKFTSDNMWASNVIIREWVFKPKAAS